jgi:hypothetical protein
MPRAQGGRGVRCECRRPEACWADLRCTCSSRRRFHITGCIVARRGSGTLLGWRVTGALPGKAITSPSFQDASLYTDSQQLGSRQADRVGLGAYEVAAADEVVGGQRGAHLVGEAVGSALRQLAHGRGAQIILGGGSKRRGNWSASQRAAGWPVGARRVGRAGRLWRWRPARQPAGRARSARAQIGKDPRRAGRRSGHPRRRPTRAAAVLMNQSSWANTLDRRHAYRDVLRRRRLSSVLIRQTEEAFRGGGPCAS